MKRKILKIVTVVLLLAILTMPNFIYVGAGIVSYAESSTATSHQNVEFDAELKEGNLLGLSINVKKEGYFNGEITLENSNFTFDTEATNSYINKIESNKITLNQINAGSNAQFDLKIKPVESEYFDIGLLSAVSKLNISGSYKDSSEKDIKITGTREVEYKYTENNTEENIESTARVITNKVIKVSGEDKRVVQLEMNLGLKENNYPIKEIELSLDVPSINGKYPEVIRKYDFGTMQRCEGEYKYDSEQSRVTVKFFNEPKENKIRWVKQGNEKVVLTFIYDEDARDATLDDVEYARNLINGESSVGLPAVKVTLYNDKELNKIVKMTKDVMDEEKEELVNVTTTNLEDTIYKGKLYAGVDRQYESKTNIAINLANAEQFIDVKESTDNVVFNKTIIKNNALKRIFGEDNISGILGENGQITIYNENLEIVAIINNKTERDESGNIVIEYTESQPKSLEIKTTIPVKEGNIEIINTKSIKAENSEIFKDLTELSTKTSYEYIENEIKESTSTIKLDETKTEAELLVNKDTLSTVVENNVEMKAVLKGNNEQYNLFKNPVITFELPTDVESASVKSANIIYDNELNIKNCEVNGRIITVYLEGEQTEYKNPGIEGTVIILNINAVVNKKAATKDAKINMTVTNNEENVTDSKNIRIVAQKDITPINSIKQLNIETIGQEEIKVGAIQRGTNAKTLEASFEIINNNENAIENVKVLGTFPTKNTQNNIDIKITEGISIEGAEVYYTENENANEDIQNSANGWNREIADASKVKKYLIIVPSIDMQSSVEGTYKFEVPELLEYNKSAVEGYTVKYTNSLTKIESQIKATSIKLETGSGPVLEAKLIATVGDTSIDEQTTVKNGEVIKYRVEVSNTGSEELNNVIVSANIPEGATLVTPQNNYEYTGASYYKELPNKTYDAKIEHIGVGEVKSGEYEVRVNSDTKAGSILENEAQIKYGDVTKKSNKSRIITEDGDIRVTVKRVTDRNIDLYETGSVKYYAIIENISDKKQDNVQIKTNLSPNLKVESLELVSGIDKIEDDVEIYNPDEDETIDTDDSQIIEPTFVTDMKLRTQEIQYNDTISIDSLEKNEIKILDYGMSINKLENSNITKFSVLAQNADKQYKSNIIEDRVKNINVSMNMTANTTSQYVKSGDTIEYSIVVKNNSTERIEGVVVKDKIPDVLTVQKVTFDGEEIEKLKEINDIEISCNIAPQSEATIKIIADVNYSAARTTAEAITNTAYAEMLGEKVATTQEVNHIIEADEPDTPGGGGDTPTGGDVANGKQIITGVAWYDENTNGKKDEGEKTLNNIKVHLLNTETDKLVKDINGNILEATTNDNGIYILDNLKNGKYIVIFEYNNTLYTLTKYKVENAQESENSNVLTNELLIENQKQAVASTDIIEIRDNNISNINIGLIELKDFAFRLDKYVSRILIQNSAGTTVKEYTNATVAKAELDAKKVKGTNVIIEYEIKVTNIGEIDGYVRKVVDYVPNDLKFSSELNKDWYQSGSDLYNASLANERIPAGESRTVKLTLTKAMTEDNTGLINNTAEIAESYNELGIKDSKSTAGNKTQGESDYGSADTILSLKTGEETYIAITAVAIAILGIIVFVIVIRKQNKGDIK